MLRLIDFKMPSESGSRPAPDHSAIAASPPQTLLWESGSESRRPPIGTASRRPPGRWSCMQHEMPTWQRAVRGVAHVQFVTI